MDIKSLRFFLQVAETLSFNRASERLNISQPVVTKVIAQLEHEIGTKLFERTTRRVALTMAGLMLLKEVKPLIAHVESVQQSVRHSIAEKSGRFTIGYTTIAMQTVLPDLIRQFKSEYPDIELEVRELTSQQQVEALLSAEIDVGFVLTPIDDSALSIIPLHKEHLKLAVPDHHPHALSFKDNKSAPLSVFANDHFIIPSRQQFPAVHDEIIRACHGAGFKPRIKECGENQSCMGLARAGLGIVFISGNIADISSEGLIFIDIEDPAPVLVIAIAWRTKDPSSLLGLFRQHTLRPITE